MAEMFAAGIFALNPLSRVRERVRERGAHA
jgi:hypothetical protein